MSEINELTLAQIKGFVSSIARQKIEQRMAFILGVAVGAQSDSKGIKKTVTELDNALRMLDNKLPIFFLPTEPEQSGESS